MTPRQWQVAIATGFVMLAVLVQAVLVARLPGPVAGPAFVLATVVALGMASGQSAGAIAGFGAGLALDVLPPADGLVGSTACAFVVAGYLAGRIRDPRGLAPLQVMGVGAVLAAISGILMLVFAVLLDGAAPAVGPAAVALLSYVALSGLLSLGVVPLVGTVMRRVVGGQRTRRRIQVAR